MNTNGYKLMCVSGPDAGRYVVLDNTPATVGRGSDAELHLSEHYISRHHFTICTRGDGFAIEVLSSSGLRIGPKRKKYRKGKQLIIDADESIFIGSESELVVVAADKAARLARDKSPQDAAAQMPTAQTSILTSSGQQVADQARRPAARHGISAASDTTATLTSPAASIGQKKKSKKIYLFLLIYLLVIAGVGVTISLMSEKKANSASKMPEVFDGEYIHELMVREDEMAVNRAEADQRLADARRRFGSRHIAPGDSYRCLRDYIAYRLLSDEVRYPQAYDHEHYTVVLDELDATITPLYTRACMALKQRRYDSAIEDFTKLLEMVPMQVDPLNKNFQKHLSYAKKMKAATRKSDRKSRLR